MKNIPPRTLPVIPSFLNPEHPTQTGQEFSTSDQTKVVELPKKSRSSIKEEKARERASMLRLAKVIGDLHLSASTSTDETEARENAALLGQTVLRNLETIVYALRIAGGAEQPFK